MIVHTAEQMGVTAQRLLEVAGLDPFALSDPDVRIPLALETRLWEIAASLGDDADFGLHAAETIRPGAFDVLDYAVRTAPDLSAALSRIVRYNKLVHDVAEFTVSDQTDAVCITHRFTAADIRPCRHASEFTLASLLVIGEQLTGQALKPLAVSFSHAQPNRTAEHLRIFGVMPLFGTPHSSLTLPRSALDLPIPNADAALSRIVMAHAEQLLATCTIQDAAAIVRRHLVAGMANGPLALSQVADLMSMGERSLQRRLESEGTSLAELADEVRKELALHYIADHRLALGEVAYLLGFAEPSPFHRAFKRWTGMTPAAARRAGV